MHVSTRYITMTDGVRIAASLYLPRGLKAGQRLPTILSQNRYHRSDEYRFPYNLTRGRGPTATPFIAPMVAHGYAYLITDVRGAGASFGRQDQPFSPREIEDGGEIADWIVAQPWSNGRVGVEGVSYNGTAAELLLAAGRPQVKAAVLLFNAFDIYADILFPGGIFLAEFARRWGLYTRALDADRPDDFAPPALKGKIGGVTPAGPLGRLALGRAIAGHRANLDFTAAAGKLSWRSDVADGFSPQAMSAYLKAPQIAASGAAIFAITGWLDGGYQAAALNRFATLARPGDKVWIGPWAHGATQIDRASNKAPVKFDVLPAFKAFFDAALQDDAPEPPEIRYYTLVAERWRTTRVWPPPGAPRSFYLAEGHALADAPPTAAEAAEAYRVDPEATTGDASRWISYVNFEHRKIGYPDRAAQDARNLVYTSTPLADDLESTGRPQVTLHLASDQPDGAVFVYLEDVWPTGEVEYVTEGQLRLVARTPAAEAPYRSTGVYRSFEQADARPMIPGEPAEIGIDLLPISYLFRRGHAVRLSIAGADKDNFAPVGATPPTYRVHRSAGAASRLTLHVTSADPEDGGAA